MSPIITLLIALVGAFVAWKILKGVMKIVGVIVILGIAAAFYYGFGA